MNYIRFLGGLFFLLVACQSPSSPKAIGEEFTVSASCGTIKWYPGSCMETFDDDADQLMSATQRTCDMGRGRSISPYTTHGRINPKSGSTLANGLYVDGEVIYRCGFARVFAHEVTCHAWKMGCDCEDPHPEWNCN